jgi:hypothetical protein
LSLSIAVDSVLAEDPLVGVFLRRNMAPAVNAAPSASLDDHCAGIGVKGDMKADRSKNGLALAEGHPLRRFTNGLLPYSSLPA